MSKKVVKSSLFEADLNLPKEYIDRVRSQAQQQYGGFRGPSRQEMMQMGQLLRQIFQIQRGHEEELTRIGIDVINKFYGPVIQDVVLDVKIVNPDDPEKLEMAQRMLQTRQQEQQQQQQQGGANIPRVELPMRDIADDIDKRKLINNIMQGEAQNVHDMMYDVRDRVTEVTGNPRLLDLYMEFLALNKKFDWDETQNLEMMMRQAPEMANAMETSWDGGDDEGEGDGDGEGEATPTIHARVLDLPMLVHETVKGIYELIAAGAIDPDREVAQKILDATDTLTDEQEDIRFGPFIAKDIRDYVNQVADKVPGANNIPNLREFVFGKLVEMPAKEFVEIVTAMLMKEEWPARTIKNFISDIVDEFKDYAYRQSMPSAAYDEDIPGVEDFDDEDDDHDELMNLLSTPKPSQPKQAPQQPSKPSPEDLNKKLVSMSKGELNIMLNKAIDDEDWTLAQQIQQMLERRGSLKENFGDDDNTIESDIDFFIETLSSIDPSDKDAINDIFIEIDAWFVNNEHNLAAIEFYFNWENYLGK